ncbi:MAG: hypothetical protein RMJ98_19805, partial [Myxococcales bacterium]|nr:hypothetical protein [Polyangiaceae bacterium]MDW8251546.1 hypothetical protein [Myxococcales bacterium]
MGLRSFFTRRLTLLVTMLVAGASLSCAGHFDTTRRVSSQKNTLGEEIYTALCDRVGASSLTEDVSGASYRSICHKGSKGWSGTTVDSKRLPPATKAPEARRLAIAKIEAMGRHRTDLIEAFDAIFPDSKIPDPLDPKKEVRLYDALDLLTKRLTPLYESSPYATQENPEPPLMPATTQALGALMGSLSSSSKAREALSLMSGREGYRPPSRALGSLRILLAYPDLRRFTRLLLDRTGPGGSLEGKFQHALRVVEQELRAFEPDPKVAPITVEAATLQPDRPRFKLEILGSLLLAEDDVFARGDPPRFLVARDLRGFAVPRGATPGKVGTIPEPFADKNGDGYPDVDILGRFVNGSGEPLGVPPPFATPGALFSEEYTFDASERALRQGQLLFSYLDTSRTMLHAMLDDLRPITAMDDAGHSTLTRLLEGSYLLFGPKKTATADYGTGSARVTIPYQAFDANASPLLDLVHASGQFLGAPESDDFLGSILAIHEKYPEKTARALQLAWAIWNQSKSPEYAKAILDDTSTFWEEMTDWLAKVARVGPDLYTGKPGAQPPRGLLSDLTLALVHPAAIKYLPGAFAAPMRFNDRIGYNPHNVNGPPINKTNNYSLKEGGSAFQSKVNRELPDQGDNRSAFQRFARIIAAANHVNSCNKEGATLQTPLSICGFELPNGVANFLINLLTDPYKECELLQINDLGVFFVDAILDFDHPRRARLVVKDQSLLDQLGTINNLLKPFGKTCEMTINKLLKGSTGIDGVATIPSPQGLMRLVFFGAQGKTVDKPEFLDPLITGKNNDLNAFISHLLDPVGTKFCPKNAKGVNVCDSYDKTLRGIEPDTFFIAETPYLEKHPSECLSHCSGFGTEEKALCEAECNGPSSGFFEGIRPTLTAFANYSYLPAQGEICPQDPQGRCLGEQLFLDLITILDRHWSSNGSSLFRYEELLAWIFTQSDLFGTASDLVTTMDTFPYTSPRVKKGQPRSPLEITSSLISFLFDPQIAASLGITDRHGNKATTTNNGKLKAQVTPYDLFVQALRGFDKRFDTFGDPQKKAHWRTARSSLVDQFFLAENSAWKNPAIARALPILGKLVREQVNANCSTRESDKQCDWARKELTEKLRKVMEGPLFSAINDLNEALRADEEMRIELGKLLNYLLEAANSPDSFALTLTSLSDLLQVLNDEETLAPILRALSPLAAPGVIEQNGKLTPTKAPGTASWILKYLKALMDEPEDPAQWIDRYRVLDHILPRLVTPVAEGKRTPLEVILDTMAAVQRIDSEQQGPFTAEDYKAM